jgi:hypothetical protein
MNDKIKQKRTEWIQHIDRMNNERLTIQIREYNPRGRWSVGSPRRRWSELEGWCISSEQASMLNPWSEEDICMGCTATQYGREVCVFMKQSRGIYSSVDVASSAFTDKSYLKVATSPGLSYRLSRTFSSSWPSYSVKFLLHTTERAVV